ncbi:glycoprotein-N-acetylgalactosamine 3-beta-galactosyltransferase 1-like [Haliotis rufescens]|uniref:glycoprotein-N-acetylgalactosamine 3-beta-galactosyltransferase 1-like n=1 Tax=Haliotis rufescens TaxID=6454 RepID=UPI00201F1099|nr:glycoprotein-N-acetylgalactosamine 3-beta-galactosyltransferase 1-like [Haliotis rufescens]
MTTWRLLHVVTAGYIAFGFSLGALVSQLFLNNLGGLDPLPRGLTPTGSGQRAIDIRWRQRRERFIAENKGKTNIADDLIQRVTILCFIVIAEDQVVAKRSVYQQTWGRRCDRLLLFSTSATDPDTIILKVPKAGHPVEDDSYASLQALKYIYTHHLEEAHWFIRVHPMTFVVLENLRYFLKDEDYNKPIYFGQVLREGNAVFPLGSAGYVISREAISKFGASSPPKTSCKGSTSSECLVVAECFRHLGIILGDSRDALDRSRFHGISVESVSVHEYPAWFAELDVHHNMTKQGIKSVSDISITISPVSDSVILALEYFLYRAGVYGAHLPMTSLNKIHRQLA